MKQEQREELQALREAHRQTLEILRQQSEQELQTLRFELEDEGKAMLGADTTAVSLSQRCLSPVLALSLSCLSTVSLLC